jgi:ABC-2 type transport system ATP-binding protein
MTTTPALILDNVRLAWQGADAPLLSIKAQVGDKLLVLGSNGCGKTTLVETICGYLQAVTGTVGRSSRLGYVPQQPKLPTSISVESYFEQLVSLCADDVVNDAQQCMGFLGLAPHAKRKISDLSRGWQQRINLAQAWLGDPQLIILDEPQTALDPDGMTSLRNVIADSDACVLIFSPPGTGCETLVDTHLNYSELC